MTTSSEAVTAAHFRVTFDDAAMRWLAEHPTDEPLAIAYSERRC